MNKSKDLLKPSRRRFIASTVLALTGMTTLSRSSFASSFFKPDSAPNSKFNGVQIGVIVPYSFRSMPGTAQDLLKYCVSIGINAVEMQNTPIESFAGAPTAPAGLFGPPPPGGGKRQLTPEQQTALDNYTKALKEWRLSVSMDKFKALRKLYQEAGVTMYGFKLPLTQAMSDAEYDYAFNAAKAVGANQLTMELPTEAELTKRIGEFATKHKLMVGYHAHTQATPELWDVAMSQSKYNGINLDIGHYVAGTSQSPIPLIKKYHDKITSMHLKDRKFNNGPNMPWGQGDTPIKEVLQLMKKEKYSFPATIELEYTIPQDSDAEKEVAKCLAYAKEALS
ncbi:Sugar phosphate isomerase/epimerase [Pseudarcicella hirudinis]|uniref:Sugar phosphate isomerase/epimerase n=2 Tax=Pseudarcicella hirudinis TaxID=1079859 RepID=A0A1I5SW20_9BACT|nr:sugar phosphate isomerase/epimerase [Pseudarcicella hirudinis]SFP74940.1 Sugar phosphate isomerase/epimerase [Pseudarcicella hirudinis]